LQEGEVEVGSGGEEITQVLRVENYERGNETRDIYLTVKLTGYFNQRSQKFIFKSRPIEVGAPIELHLSKVFVTGLVMNDDLEEAKPETKEFKVVGRWRDVDPWQAREVKVGEKMVDAGSGKAIAEILGVRKELPSTDILISSYKGVVSIQKDPKRRDLIITMDLLAEKHGNEYYFAGHQKLKVGEVIWVYLSNVDIEYMSVMEIKEK